MMSFSPIDRSKAVAMKNKKIPFNFVRIALYLSITSRKNLILVRILKNLRHIKETIMYKKLASSGASREYLWTGTKVMKTPGAARISKKRSIQKYFRLRPNIVASHPKTKSSIKNVIKLI